MRTEWIEKDQKWFEKAAPVLPVEPIKPAKGNPRKKKSAPCRRAIR